MVHFYTPREVYAFCEASPALVPECPIGFPSFHDSKTWGISPSHHFATFPVRPSAKNRRPFSILHGLLLTHGRCPCRAGEKFHSEDYGEDSGYTRKDGGKRKKPSASSMAGTHPTERTDETA